MLRLDDALVDEAWAAAGYVDPARKPGDLGYWVADTADLIEWVYAKLLERDVNASREEAEYMVDNYGLV